MAQIRVEKKRDFTLLANKLIQDPGLSLKAKGLMAYMLSLPEDWDYSIEGLAIKCKEGKTAIRTAIAELMGAGYVTRTLVRGEGGLLGGYEYVVYEEPQSACENQTMDNGVSENRTEQNNNITKEELTNTPYGPPEGDGAGENESKPKRKQDVKEAPAYKPEWWAVFWDGDDAYPRKDGKQAAIKAWDKLKPDRETCQAMLKGLRRAKQSKQWTKDGGEYIPHFSTWLNGRKWEDQGVDLSLLPVQPSGGGWAPDPEVTG